MQLLIPIEKYILPIQKILTGLLFHMWFCLLTTYSFILLHAGFGYNG